MANGSLKHNFTKHSQRSNCNGCDRVGANMNSKTRKRNAAAKAQQDYQNLLCTPQRRFALPTPPLLAQPPCEQDACHHLINTNYLYKALVITQCSNM
jgi:hypothetical protein